MKYFRIINNFLIYTYYIRIIYVLKCILPALYLVFAFVCNTVLLSLQFFIVGIFELYRFYMQNTAFEAQFMKKLSNTEVELKKGSLIKKVCN